MRRQWTYVLFAVALLLVGTWAWSERTTRLRLGNAVEAEHQRAFYNLLGSVEQSEVYMAKSLVSGSPRLNMIYLTDAGSNASEAQNYLAELPFQDLNLSATRKFFNQVGDYSYSLAHQLADGKDITNEQWDTLSRLHNEIDDFGKKLHGIESDMARDGFRWSNTLNGKGGMRTASAASPPWDGFSNLDRRMQEMPSLVYDGPFSDHLTQQKPLGLTGPEISQDQAIKVARDFADGPRSPLKLLGTRRINGKIPAYSVSFARGDNNLTVDVSIKGGKVIQAIDDRESGRSTLDRAEAVKRAGDFVASRGYAGLKPTYTLREGDFLVIAMVADENGTFIYPDQVKVKVALDNGQVAMFDATAYLTAHHGRKLSQPEISQAEALKRINPRLKVERVSKALIPDDVGREILSYEVRARLNKDIFLVYVNAMSGKEERILKVINQPGGELVM